MSIILNFEVSNLFLKNVKIKKKYQVILPQKIITGSQEVLSHAI